MPPQTAAAMGVAVLPGHIRILLVEDDEADAELIIRALAGAGWDAAVARHSNEADFQAALASDSWDVILSDVHLPSFDAPRVLDILKEHQVDTPVIVVSGTVGEEAAADLMRLGAADFVTKGNLTRLNETIERELRQTAVRLDAVRARAAMRESEARLQAFVDSAMDAIISCDTDQRVVMFNPAAERVFGWDAAEIVGQRLDALLPERYRWIHSAHVRDFGVSGVTNRTMANLAPLTGRRKDGTEFPIEVTISQAHVQGGTFYTAVVRDVSERRRLESELLQAQKMEAIGRLSGGIAHDFNNLLTAITGYSELAVMEADDPIAVGENLKEVLGAAERASALTKQLLALSRKQPSETKVLDPNEVVTEIHNMLRRVLGEDIELVSSLDETIGHIRADRGQVNQVLLNLAVNARDAMPEGGRLEIRTFTGSAELDDGRVPWVGGYAAISVIDSGSGIPEEDHVRIFEPFYTTKPQGKGTGLGLSIVRSIVESHQGTITVESGSGAGTCFTIYFPISGAELDSPQLPSIASDAIGTETVVLIEDDDSLRQLEAHILNRHGYTVHSFGRPGDALSAAIPYVDLLVSDVVLPGMSGPVAAASFRERWPHLKVLFLSGYTGESFAETQGLMDGRALLQKPFSTQEFARRVRDLLDERNIG